MVQQQTTKETEIEKVAAHRSWRKYTALRVQMGRLRQKMDRERAPGRPALLGFVDGVLWGCWAKTRLVKLDPKEGFW